MVGRKSQRVSWVKSEDEDTRRTGKRDHPWMEDI